MRKVKRKVAGYPPLPKGKRGVKRKLFGGKEARRARRADRQEDRQERRDARKEARQQAKEDGVGLFGRLRAGFQAGREVREQQQLEDMQPDPNEVTETDPAMTGAVGGGVDTSAAGVGMDTGGGAAKRGGLRDRRKRLKQLGGGSGIDFRTKEERKADEKREKKEAKANKKEERRVGRKVKRYSRIGRRKEGEKEGSGQTGVETYRDKLRNKAKRKRKRKARRKKVGDFGKKVVAGVKGRMTARRNRRKLEGSRSGAGSGCEKRGDCGAYK
tara:strand:- start:32847 stop:33659 length:813 start_codon:yes stop_codon:yes gene_type:complete